MPRKRAGKRGETWEIKTRPDLLHPVLEAKHEEMAKSIKQAYFSIDQLYERVAQILDSYGVHTQARLAYRSYASELWKLSQRYSGKTLQNQAGAIYSTYFRYGLDSDILKEIAKLLGIEIPKVGLDYVVLG